MNSRPGSGGAPQERRNSSNEACSSPCVRRNSCAKAAQSERSATGYPEKTGGSAGSGISSGLHETMRTQRRPLAASAGKETTLSSTITSGCSSSMISSSRVCT